MDIKEQILNELNSVRFILCIGGRNNLHTLADERNDYYNTKFREYSSYDNYFFLNLVKEFKDQISIDFDMQSFLKTTIERYNEADKIYKKYCPSNQIVLMSKAPIENFYPDFNLRNLLLDLSKIFKLPNIFNLSLNDGNDYDNKGTYPMRQFGLFLTYHKMMLGELLSSVPIKKKTATKSTQIKEIKPYYERLLNAKSITGLSSECVLLSTELEEKGIIISEDNIRQYFYQIQKKL